MTRALYLFWLRGTEASLLLLCGLGVFAAIIGIPPRLSVGYALTCAIALIGVERLHRRPGVVGLAAVGIALAGAALLGKGWYRGAMHDLGLVFGHHGRFGCGVIDAHGHSKDWLRDEMFGWLLFTPIAVFGAIRWIQGRRATSG